MHRLIGMLAFVSIGVSLLIAALGLRINPSPSLAQGLYRVIASNPESVAVGQLVSLCPPALPLLVELRESGQLPGGSCPGGLMPFMKRVAAVGGAHYSVSAAGVSIDGKLLRETVPLGSDTLPRGGSGVLAGNEYFGLASDDPRSIDSRYLGPLRVADVISILEPVWTVSRH